jgi:hypothetical protein
MRHKVFPSLAKLVLLLGVPSLAAAQSAQQNATFTITGVSGQIPIVQLSGRSYISVESLARLTQGSLSFRGNQTILNLLAPAPAPQQQQQPPVNKGFSKDFLKAGIEEMTVIREWRVAIVNAVQTNNPVSEDWVSRYRLAANSKLALAGAAATTDSDRNAFQLLTNEFNNMQQMSEQFVSRHNNVQYTSPDSFDNNPLDDKILGCAHALAAMAANNQFEDDPSCH